MFLGSVRRLPFRILPVVCLLLLSAACGGGHAEKSWHTSGSPLLTLRGPAVVDLLKGTKYVDAGATAEDARDGDINARIRVRGLKALDVNAVGDYLIRYSVTNSRGKSIRGVRIVRVSKRAFATATARPLGTTAAGMGYYEHLPIDYGTAPSKRFPLLIWVHGAGRSRSSGAPGYQLQLLNGLDIFGLIGTGSWDDSLPFIVLMPQRNSEDVFGLKGYSQMKAFIAYAVRTYNVDISRIYMAGFSNGAYFTWRYLTLYPNQIAAAVPIAGYLNSGYYGCFIKTPVWAFQDKDDPIVPWQDTLSTVNVINKSPKGCLSERARFTLFPSGGHSPLEVLFRSDSNLGNPAYDLYKPDVFSWLLEHHLG